MRESALGLDRRSRPARRRRSSRRSAATPARSWGRCWDEGSRGASATRQARRRSSSVPRCSKSTESRTRLPERLRCVQFSVVTAHRSGQSSLVCERVPAALGSAGDGLLASIACSCRCLAHLQLCLAHASTNAGFFPARAGLVLGVGSLELGE